jgi:hypothetical protein
MRTSSALLLLSGLRRGDGTSENIAIATVDGHGYPAAVAQIETNTYDVV